MRFAWWHADGGGDSLEHLRVVELAERIQQAHSSFDRLDTGLRVALLTPDFLDHCLYPRMDFRYVVIIARFEKRRAHA
jgi:hypothetical protein